MSEKTATPKETLAPAPPPIVSDPVAAALLRDRAKYDPLEFKRQLLSRVKVLRSGMSNLGDVRGKTPGYAYCWVFNDRQVIDQYAGMMYELVTSSNEPDLETAFKKEDGRHVRGDAILLRCRLEIVEAWDADRDLRALERQDGAREEFATWGENTGVPIERGPKHGRN